MDSHTLRVLEFDKVIDKVAGFASSQVGKEAVRALEPTSLPKVVETLQGETTEVANLLVTTGSFPLDGIHDLRPALEQASVEGAAVEGIELYHVAETMRAAAIIKRFILKQEGRCPNIERLARQITELDQLANSIASAIDDQGRVVDGASPALRNIRQGMARVEAQIRKRLNQTIQDPDVRSCLQDDYVTLRDGRYVLPVLSHRKNEIRGLVHDRSDTGQTVFIEPQAVVELGNELRDLIAQERVEVRRILRELTTSLRESADLVERNLDVLAAADAIYARARFGLHYNLREPQFADEPELRLVDAKHPLLLFARAPAVGNNVTLGPDCRILVVSGPNAGGKTVALKTIGLLQLMVQAGLHVPASEQSRFPVFSDVLADIGDEQSIEQALSSFSGHIAQLNDVLAKAGANTLVLIDELGTATDPNEGGALACALLDELYDSQALCIVTSHLHEPKVMAHDRPAMENAAVQFDLDTLRPTYQLEVGLPGSSHAFDIASRIGTPQRIIDKAKALMGQGAADLEGLLASVRHRSQELDAELEHARAARIEAEELRQQYDQTMADVKSKTRQALKKANLEAERVLAEAQKEADEIIAEVKREADERGGKEVRSEVVTKIRTRSRRSRSRRKQEAERLDADMPERIDVNDVKEGMDVFVISLGKNGKVLSVKPKQGRAAVKVGATQFELKISDLARARPGPVTRPTRPAIAARSFAPSAPVERRLDLLGKRAEAAKAEVERYLENAMLSGFTEVCIVHGFGTGALRKVVREVLAGHPLVKSFREGEKGEGGGGATIVQLGD